MALGLSNREAAKVAGCSHVAIGKAIRTGRLTPLADGSVDPDVLAAWNKQRGPHRGGNHRPVTAHPGETPAQAADRIIAESGVPTHDRAEAERIIANYNALLRQLEYDTKSSVVAAVADIASMVGSEYAQVRTKLLAIPSEQAPRIHRLKTVTEVQDALHGMIVEALEGLTRDRASA